MIGHLFGFFFDAGRIVIETQGHSTDENNEGNIMHRNRESLPSVAILGTVFNRSNPVIFPKRIKQGVGHSFHILRYGDRLLSRRIELNDIGLGNSTLPRVVLADGQ